MAKVFSFLAFFLSAAMVCGQSLIFTGTVDLDPNEEYIIIARAWDEMQKDSILPGTWQTVYYVSERGPYTFELERYYRYLQLIFVDSKKRVKYVMIAEHGHNEGTYTIDVSFSEKTSLIFFKSDVKNTSVQSRVIRTRKY